MMSGLYQRTIKLSRMNRISLKALLSNTALLACISLLALGCVDGDGGGSDDSGGSVEDSTIIDGSGGTTEKQYNITVLLDLSDRVEREGLDPDQSVRDISIVRELLMFMKGHMVDKGVHLSKDKFRVIFSPTPSDPNINSLAKELRFDLSKLDQKGKKFIYDSASVVFTRNLEKIYQMSIDANDWPGCDIWRFFKNDVSDFCVDLQPEYENILFVITDGYIYHDDTRDTRGNRATYLTSGYLTDNNLRGNPRWRETMANKDLGLLPVDGDFEAIDVMVLEVNPTPRHKSDEDYIKAIWSKWFDEIGVGNYKIYNTDIPANTAIRLKKYFKGAH